jgi:hypothetical protein
MMQRTPRKPLYPSRHKTLGRPCAPLGGSPTLAFSKEKFSDLSVFFSGADEHAAWAIAEDSLRRPGEDRVVVFGEKTEDSEQLFTMWRQSVGPAKSPPDTQVPG